MSKTKIVKKLNLKNHSKIVKVRSFFRLHYKKILLFLLLLLLITSIYFLGYSNGQSKVNESQKSKANISNDAPKTQKKKSTEEKLDERLERAKKSIERDLKKEKLSQNDASKLSIKNEELYIFSKQNLDKDRDDPVIEAKIIESSSWAKENEVSQKYLIKIY